jgi:hypothetical protein
LGRLELMVEIAGKLLAHTDRSHGVQQELWTGLLHFCSVPVSVPQPLS